MQNKKNIFTSDPWRLSLFLILAGGLVYLPLMAGMGYFNDDWYLMYAAGAKGAAAFRDIFIIDRPLRAWVMSLAYMLFGADPFLYNLSGWFFRTLSAVIFFHFLRLLFSNLPKTAFIAALLYLLYPGFLSQFNGIDYQSQMVSLAAAMASLLLLFYIYHTRTRWLLAAGFFALAATTAFYLGLVEYFIGFEALKVAVIVVLVFRDQASWSNRLKKSILWGSYVLGAAAPFLYWRLFIFESQRGATDVDLKLGSVLSEPVLVLRNWSVTFFQDLFDVTLNVWRDPLIRALPALSQFEFLIALALVGLLVVFIGFVLGRWTHAAESETGSNFRVEALWLALVMLSAGLIPVILVGRQVDFRSFSRYALAPSVGSVLVWVLLLSLVSKKNLRYGVLSFFVAVSALTHYGNAFARLHETERMNAFWWQVSWRIPQMELGTTLLVNYPDIVIEEDYFVWGPAALIYYPESQQGEYPQPGVYAVLMREETVQNILTREPQEYSERRSIRTYPNYRNILIISQPGHDSCVQVINGLQPEISSHEDERFLPVMEFSEVSRIFVNDSVHLPPVIPFGSEPEHGWCYYYQKAALARQQEDWQAVVHLAEQAGGLQPEDQIEWMPFLQAYAVLGQVDKLAEVARQISDPFVLKQACEIFINEDAVSKEALEQVCK